MSVDPARTFRALHRFGLGVRPGDLAALSDIRDQLRVEAESGQLVPLTGLSFASMTEAGPALRDFAEAERLAREARQAPAATPPGPQASAVAPQASATGAPVAAAPSSAAAPVPPQPAPPQPAAPRPAPPEQPLPGRTYREEARARFLAMLEPRIGLSERLLAFWSNHFAVSVNKGNPVRMWVGLLEREAIRPNLHGRFADMLLAVETHPAMLFFLDNQQSIGPNSRAGARRGRGLNENLAREIMELHTLGVAGGYSQADVTALARIITGWTMAPPNGAEGPPGTFRFNPNMHEPGAQTLLGKTYAEGGFEQGREALNDLARHPSTARHIARKLARHFVADDPPASMVERLAGVFRDSDGDLRAVSRALVDAPEAWSTPPSKIRTPHEFLVASARALGRKPEIGQILQPLNAMGQPLWQPGGPNGFPDSVAAWASPEGIKTRLDVSSAIARQVASGIEPRQFLDDIFGAGASAETRAAVMRAESRYQALSIALMSPEFQRR